MIKNKKVIITVLSFVIIMVGIVAGTILVQNNQDFRKIAAPLTNLSFNPTNVSIIQGQKFSVNSKIDTGTNLVTGIDIEIIYDPVVIQLDTITPTNALSSFSNPETGRIIKNEIDNTAGKARFIAYTQNKTLGVSGTHDILTITGTVANSASVLSYQISYGTLTAIAALNEGQNALLNKTGLTLNVTLPTSTPTVSPTASPSPNWDVDQNGLINIVDIGLVVDQYGVVDPTNIRADVNGDDTINIVDIGIIVDHYQ